VGVADQFAAAIGSNCQSTGAVYLLTAAVGAAPVPAASSPAAAQSVYMSTAASAVVAARVLNVAAAADLDILLDMSALCILDFVDDILGLDIFVYMSTFDIPADVLADFPLLCMSALDILVDLLVLDILHLEIDDLLGLDILVDMSTFDLPADVFADFLLLGMLDTPDHSC